MEELLESPSAVARIHRFSPGLAGSVVLSLPDFAARHGHWRLICDRLVPRSSLTVASLHAAVRADDLELVRTLVDDYGVDVNDADQFGWRALHVAVTLRRTRIARWLLLLEQGPRLKGGPSTVRTRRKAASDAPASDGVRPSEIDPEYWNEAIASGHRPDKASVSTWRPPNDMASAMLQLFPAGSNPTAMLSPAEQCVRIRKLVAKLGLSAVAEFAVETDRELSEGYNDEMAQQDAQEGRFPVMVGLIIASMVSAMRMLLELGADPNLPLAANGGIPLSLACRQGELGLAQMLLDFGSAIEGRAKANPLHMAAQSGSMDCVRLLLENNASPNSISEGKTPLFYACAHDHVDCMELLVEYGADLAAVAEDGISLIHIAANGENEKAMAYLCTCGMSARRSIPSVGGTALHMAAQAGSDECVRLLLHQDAIVDAILHDGTTPLLLAALNGHTKCVTRLLDWGACPNARRRMQGPSPLFVACQKGHESCARVLLSHGADASAVCIISEGNPMASPLSIACQNGYSECARLVIQAGARLDQESNGGVLPLTIAAHYGWKECVRVVCEFAAKQLCPSDILDEKGSDGDTALHKACRNDCLRVAAILVQAGASVYVRNRSGLTPAALVRSRPRGEEAFADAIEMGARDRRGAANRLRRLAENTAELRRRPSEIEGLDLVECTVQ